MLSMLKVRSSVYPARNSCALIGLNLKCKMAKNINATASQNKKIKTEFLKQRFLIFTNIIVSTKKNMAINAISKK